MFKLRILLLMVLFSAAIYCASARKGGGGGGTGQGAGRGRGGGGGMGNCVGGDCPYKSFNVTITIRNNWTEPFFEHSVTLPLRRYQPLIRYLERACAEDPENFETFSATYFYQWGYYINAFNGLYSNYDTDKTYWHISNDEGALTKGVSSYIPKPEDNILFDLIYSP